VNLWNLYAAESNTESLVQVHMVIILCTYIGVYKTDDFNLKVP
jgi:hypothetical protein